MNIAYLLFFIAINLFIYFQLYRKLELKWTMLLIFYLLIFLFIVLQVLVLQEKFMDNQTFFILLGRSLMLIPVYYILKYAFIYQLKHTNHQKTTQRIFVKISIVFFEKVIPLLLFGVVFLSQFSVVFS